MQFARERGKVTGIHLTLTTFAGEEIQIAIDLQEYDRLNEFENAVLDQLPYLGESSTFGCELQFVHKDTHKVLVDPIWNNAERAGSKFDTFYRTMDLTNPIKAMQYDQINSEQGKEAEQAEQATQDEQAEQTTVPTQQTMTGPSALAGLHPADRFTTARTSSQCTDRQATVAATGSNQ